MRLLSSARAYVFSVILIALLGPPAAFARDSDWEVYLDPAHGCRLDYPRSLFSADPPEEGQPLRFSSEDESTYFRVMGVENVAQWRPSEIKAKYLRADMPGDITYERTKSGFLVLSGYRNEAIFYTKVAVSDDQHTVCILDITYPRSRKREFDAIVTRMSHSFEVAE